MIQPEDVLSLNFYTYGQAFSGSDHGMRYKLIKVKEKKDEEGHVTEPQMLQVSRWPEPFSYDKTAPELILTKLFEFSEEGRLAAVAWLNEEREAGDWQTGIKLSRLKQLRDGE